MKSKSSSEIPLCKTPHIASRKSDMKRMSRSDARSASRSIPKYAARRRRSSSTSNSWFTEKLARSKNLSPMPAYSQSTIRIAPSSRKFALSKSLWQGTSGCGPRAARVCSATPPGGAQSLGRGADLLRHLTGGDEFLRQPDGVPGGFGAIFIDDRISVKATRDGRRRVDL